MLGTSVLRSFLMLARAPFVGAAVAQVAVAVWAATGAWLLT
jgi:hypothetical protein